MQYEERDKDEVRELKRPRAVDEEQLEDLLHKIGTHAKAERERVDALRVAPTDREILLEAALQAQRYQAVKMITTWMQTGQVIPWHAEPQPFHSKRVKEVISEQRKAAARLRKEDVVDPLPTPDQHTTVFERAEVARPIRDASMAAEVRNAPVKVRGRARMTPGSFPDPTFEAMTARKPLLLAVAVRTLRIFIHHGYSPTLRTRDQQIARFYLELGAGVPALTADDVTLIQDFSRDDIMWRSQLAAALSCSAATITGVVKKLDAIMRRGIYLFVLLAPPARVVIDSAEMSKLLDLIYHDNDELTLVEQGSLRKASDHLRRRDDEFQIATDGLMKPAVDELHLAEGAYAVHVPHQSAHTPKFLCVARCARHLP